MDKLPGVSGRTIKDYFETEGVGDEEQKDILRQADVKLKNIADTVRRDIGLDKPWRLKDFMIVFGTDSNGKKVIERMLPIDFERAKIFDPERPHSEKLGQDLDSLIEQSKVLVAA